MKTTMIIMSAAVLLLGVLAFFQGGLVLLGQGVLNGLLMFFNVLPLLFAAFAISGLAQVLVNPQKICRLLGKGSGFRGILLAAAVGGTLPGGPYVYYPIAASLAAAGAEASAIMAFVLAKSLWDVSRLPMEVAIMGGHVAAVRYAVTFVFPVLIGLLAQWLYPGLTQRLLPVTKKEGAK
ncbi:MAG TPA: permease [Candidatus Limnocylindrales bacterium]|nr:permease [Candidatus Limnocylindrales bacterium]